MTATGTRQADGPRALRVLTAVLALYALVLQAVLGGAMAMPADAPFGPICVAHADGSTDTAPAAPHDPASHHAGCCTLCHPATASAPPLPAATAIVWPARAGAVIAWRMDGAVAARAPPSAHARPRAPPVV